MVEVIKKSLWSLTTDEPGGGGVQCFDIGKISSRACFFPRYQKHSCRLVRFEKQRWGCGGVELTSAPNRVAFAPYNHPR